jgi:hypothetical protein
MMEEVIGLISAAGGGQGLQAVNAVEVLVQVVRPDERR